MTTHPRLLSTSLTTGDKSNPEIVGGHGVWFELADGREVIDASNTAAPLGHGHPEIVEAIRRAAGAPVINEGWRWKDRTAAADDLVAVAFSGEDWVGAVRFFISASEANDAALSLCQALTGRADLATRERAYHGGAGPGPGTDRAAAVARRPVVRRRRRRTAPAGHGAPAARAVRGQGHRAA